IFVSVMAGFIPAIHVFPPSPLWGGSAERSEAGAGVLCPQSSLYTPTRRIVRCARNAPPSPQGGGIRHFIRVLAPRGQPRFKLHGPPRFKRDRLHELATIAVMCGG